MTTPTRDTTLALAAPAPPDGRLAIFVQRHLFDYNGAAIRLWSALVIAGVLSVAWAFWQLPGMPRDQAIQLWIGVGLVAVAALFPVPIPRTKYSVGVADVFVLTLLALHGAPAAVLGAAAEGLVGAMRSSKRLTSRLSTPSVAGASMLLCGGGFGFARESFEGLGGSAAVSSFVALCLVALPYFAGTTLPLLAVVALKNRQRLSIRAWALDYSWVGAIYLSSAVVAGVLAMNARNFGPGVIVVAAAAAAAVVALMRSSLGRHEAERLANESRIAEAERELAINQQRFNAAFTHAAIGMAIVRPDGAVHQVNEALCALLGCEANALTNRPFVDVLHPSDVELFRRRFDTKTGGDGESLSMELRCRNVEGREIWVSLHCGRFIDPAEHQSGLIYQLHDISSRRLAERELHHTAYHDSLTDLANRSCFNERLELAVERSRTDAAQPFAVVFLDLDRFKTVNDSLGHVAGNRLLREVAGRLLRCVRPGDLVARLGGDEFALLLEQLQAPQAAMELAQRLIEALAAPVSINGTEVVPMASIGVTVSDLGYRTADEMLRDADLAMYAAKADGRRRVAMFDQSMLERIEEKLRLEVDLRGAIGDGQLSVVYQPLYDLDPHRIAGFEALARWMHPERGAISPEVFIALAEDSGHIEALTAWVINEAVGQLAHWHREHPEMALLGMHVNISGRDLADPGLVPHVRAVLQRHALQPHHLTLEITETTLMGKLADALDALGKLRKVGVKFSIDDFGTGYSSLAYLSKLPIDSLKIDRSFVIGMDQGPQNIEIVRAVLDLGRSLGKKVIAEGIETVEQLTTLKELGVPVGQGYLLSRPLRADQVPPLFCTEAAVHA